MDFVIDFKIDIIYPMIYFNYNIRYTILSLYNNLIWYNNIIGFIYNF